MMRIFYQEKIARNSRFRLPSAEKNRRFAASGAAEI